MDAGKQRGIMNSEIDSTVMMVRMQMVMVARGLKPSCVDALLSRSMTA